VLISQVPIKTFPRSEQQTVESAVLNNEVCLFGLRDGNFSNFVQRVGAITGKGDTMQSGGNHVGDQNQFGFNMTQLICGSKYSLAMLYEIVLHRKQIEDAGKLSVKPAEDLNVALSQLASANQREQADGCVILQTQSGAKLLTYGSKLVT
jgi:hypothetical protein